VKKAAPAPAGPQALDTEHSSTIDFAEHKRRAGEGAGPYRRKAYVKRAISPVKYYRGHEI
jgi:hypothetical protein